MLMKSDQITITILWNVGTLTLWLVVMNVNRYSEVFHMRLISVHEIDFALS